MSGKWDDVFVLAGPTASGKSALAVELAEQWDAEIISADAYQVYRGLAVLTAQPNSTEKKRVRHHLVDVLGPQVESSAADFARLARAALEEIRGRNKRALVVGGSGFYLEAFFDGLPETPPPNEAIRQRLSSLTLPEMVAELQRLDPTATAIVDLQNPRRVQRAIEIVTVTGQPFASFAREPDRSVRGLVLDPGRDVLLQRIEQRTAALLENGALEEVRTLGPCSATCRKTIGLAEISAFLTGEITLAQCHERIVIATRQYAKRQRTWFRHRARWPLVMPENALVHACATLEIRVPLHSQAAVRD
ncbi:MAG: tRNA (adenosine(37)-N6)-dimethylallyltransferase MiaA [Chthoniobacterales bacterium]